MNNKSILSLLAAMISVGALNAQNNVPVEQGKYSPQWNSVEQWECPEWFKDAKFGIWAHWGPQCQAEAGDWYARFMYYEGSGAYNWNCSHFGNPSVYGLKELCRDWKADKWDPDALVKLYKSVGAKYFFALGQHHDNFDLWNSPYQEWNSVNIGPKKDLLKGWADACKKYGLPLGVSMHGSHAWTWLEKSQDYDGNLTKEDGYKRNADGTEKWWKGLDPQKLYAQRHPHSKGWENSGTIHSQWDWANGASQPSEFFKTNFQNRVLECVNDYDPDMLYFDDTVLPFYGCDETIGLNILAHYYNRRIKTHGKEDVVVMGKILSPSQKKALLWDVERGVPDRIQDTYWQTCTCIGDWHYSQATYNRNGYKSAQQVVDMLIDIVSKNGNLLLSVPVRGNGTIDDKEMKVLEGIKEWMDVNGCAIYGSRPWKTFGEGPLADAANPINAQGFNENNGYSSADVRYVQKNDTVYAFILRNTSGTYTLKSMGALSPYYNGEVKSATLLGHGDIPFENGMEGLIMTLPAIQTIAPVVALTFSKDESAVTFKDYLSFLGAKGKIFNAEKGFNTQQLDANKVDNFNKKLKATKALTTSTKEQQDAAIDQLLNLYNDIIKNGRIKATTPDEHFKTDLTASALAFNGSFKRTTNGTDRFGTPANWTVENFRIPNGKDGVKNGIDGYTGQDCLMLGVWNDAEKATDGDLKNARIYRKVHLKPGRYFFGAAFQTASSLSNEAYMFVSKKVQPTMAIPSSSIAYSQLNQMPVDGNICGLTFVINKAQDVILGFQANLLNGSATQEFRATKVCLYGY